MKKKMLIGLLLGVFLVGSVSGYMAYDKTEVILGYFDYLTAEEGSINTLATQNVIVGEHLRVDEGLHLEYLNDGVLCVQNGLVTTNCGSQ